MQNTIQYIKAAEKYCIKGSHTSSACVAPAIVSLTYVWASIFTVAHFNQKQNNKV
jgi:hypothetical protein